MFQRFLPFPNAILNKRESEIVNKKRAAGLFPVGLTSGLSTSLVFMLLLSPVLHFFVLLVCLLDFGLRFCSRKLNIYARNSHQLIFSVIISVNTCCRFRKGLVRLQPLTEAISACTAERTRKIATKNAMCHCCLRRQWVVIGTMFPCQLGWTVALKQLIL